MQIEHILNYFFYPIFPDLQVKCIEELVITFQVYYSYESYKAKIRVHNDTVAIDANVSGKKFGGSQLLAWCYVSWSMAIPEMLASLQLPFDREYEVAKGMVKS